LNLRDSIHFKNKGYNSLEFKKNERVGRFLRQQMELTTSISISIWIHSESNIFMIKRVEIVYEGTKGNLWGSINLYNKGQKKFGLEFSYLKELKGF